jgi:hypothetical protein
MERRAPPNGPASSPASRSRLPSRRQFLYAAIGIPVVLKLGDMGLNFVRGPGKIQEANEPGVFGFDPLPQEDLPPQGIVSSQPRTVSRDPIPSKEKVQEIKNGAQLIERDIAIRLKNGPPRVSRIIKLGNGIGIRIGDMRYAITNKLLNALVSDWITSVTFERETDKLCFESTRRIPGNLSGTAFVSRKEYEELLGKLLTDAPQAATYFLNCEYDCPDLERSGKEIVGVNFQRVADEKIPVAKL